MTPKLKAAIIQDNSLNIGILRHYLNVTNPEIEVCGDAESIDKAVGLIENHKPDIIFLDTHLKDGLGFQVADILLEKETPFGELVFMTMTEHSEFARKAIEYACLDFILKPITEKMVRRVTEKAKERCMQRLLLEHVLNQNPKEVSSLIVPTNQNNKISLDVSKVAYFEAQKQNTLVHFADGTSMTVFRILGYFKKELGDEPNFFQIHHALLVNASYIRSFNPTTHELIMMDGAIIEASRRLSAKFKDFWNEFSKHHFFA